ncbi:hypothetical protein [Haloarchaeobius litoreus]|uniref:Uncharacterized protein n=1 Tax=Haloarchaeobius litoreus TaxID=755306 RepID=A0ABD6DN97_9EURY|nr:hypothetical protein [Haloarchaeobius litoreus]
MDRRVFLQTAGATLAATTVAGCSGVTVGGSSEETERPPPAADRNTYASWVPAGTHSGNRVTAMTVDFELMRAEGGNQAIVRSSPDRIEDAPSDPLAGLPFSYAVLTYAIVDALVPLFDSYDRIDRAHRFEAGLVLEGSFDGLAEELASDNFEDSWTYGGFSMFSRGPLVVGTTADTFVFADSVETRLTDREGGAFRNTPTDRVEAMADVSNGDEQRFREVSPGFDALVDRLPKRTVMSGSFDARGGLLGTESPVGSYYRNPNRDPIPDLKAISLDGPVVGVATSSRFRSDGLESGIALQYEDEGSVDDEADIRAVLGSTAAEQSVEMDGRTVVVEGSFPWIRPTESSE